MLKDWTGITRALDFTKQLDITENYNAHSPVNYERHLHLLKKGCVRV